MTEYKTIVDLKNSQPVKVDGSKIPYIPRRGVKYTSFIDKRRRRVLHTFKNVVFKCPVSKSFRVKFELGDSIIEDSGNVSLSYTFHTTNDILFLDECYLPYSDAFYFNVECNDENITNYITVDYHEIIGIDDLQYPLILKSPTHSYIYQDGMAKVYPENHEYLKCPVECEYISNSSDFFDASEHFEKLLRNYKLSLESSDSKLYTILTQHSNIK